MKLEMELGIELGRSTRHVRNEAGFVSSRERSQLWNQLQSRFSALIETKRHRGHERHAAVHHAVVGGSRGPRAKEPFVPWSQSPSLKSVKPQ